jgi:capsular polysaccharide transport system permease protein
MGPGRRDRFRGPVNLESDMTVPKTTDEKAETIKFPLTKEEQRDQKLVKKPVRDKAAADVQPDGPKIVPKAAAVKAKVLSVVSGDALAPKPQPKEQPKEIVEADTAADESFKAPKKRLLNLSWTNLSFALFVLIPGLFSAFYFMVLASPQFMVESQFSVRGSSSSSMGTFGLGGLLGSSVQSNDAYIVSSYIESPQLIRDVRQQLGIDLRQYYSRPGIDFYYQIPADMPLEKFTEYWRKMVEISFNSTTGNTTLYIYAFTPDDTKAITDAVLKVSEKLVNSLSASSRQQMTRVSSMQVERAEAKLQNVRDEIRQLRSTEKIIDPTQLSQLDFALTQKLESDLQATRTRLNTALQSVSADAPQVVVLKRTIKGLEDQLSVLKEKMAIPSDDTVANQPTKAGRVNEDGNIPGVLTKFEDLMVQQEFATKAYVTALAAFETSLTEAQKQDRYFAVFVEPVRPEIAMHPKRLLDTFVSFLILVAVWMLAQFFYRSFKDHAI